MFAIRWAPTRRCSSKPRKSAAPAPAPAATTHPSTNPSQTPEIKPRNHAQPHPKPQRSRTRAPNATPRRRRAAYLIPRPKFSPTQRRQHGALHRRTASNPSTPTTSTTAAYATPHPSPSSLTSPPHLASPRHPSNRPTGQKLDTSDTKQKQKLRYTTRPHAPRNRTQKMAPRQLSSKAGRAEPGFARSAVSALLSAENRSVVSAVGMFAVSAFPFSRGF
jgi:hypothetical protein